MAWARERRELTVRHILPAGQKLVEKDGAHIRLEVHAVEVERKGADAGRGRGADAGKHAQLALVFGELSTRLDHRLGRTVHRKRAAVVPQALPLVEHVRRIGGSESSDIGEACEPTLPAPVDPAHLGLLEHDLADPNLVGVARPAPRQVAVELAPLPADLLSIFCKKPLVERGVVLDHYSSQSRICQPRFFAADLRVWPGQTANASPARERRSSSVWWSP